MSPSKTSWWVASFFHSTVTVCQLCEGWSDQGWGWVPPLCFVRGTPGVAGTPTQAEQYTRRGRQKSEPMQTPQETKNIPKKISSQYWSGTKIRWTIAATSITTANQHHHKEPHNKISHHRWSNKRTIIWHRLNHTCRISDCYPNVGGVRRCLALVMSFGNICGLTRDRQLALCLPILPGHHHWPSPIPIIIPIIIVIIIDTCCPNHQASKDKCLQRAQEITKWATVHQTVSIWINFALTVILFCWNKERTPLKPIDACLQKQKSKTTTKLMFHITRNGSFSSCLSWTGISLQWLLPTLSNTSCSVCWSLTLPGTSRRLGRECPRWSPSPILTPPSPPCRPPS